MPMSTICMAIMTHVYRTISQPCIPTVWVSTNSLFRVRSIPLPVWAFTATIVSLWLIVGLISSPRGHRTHRGYIRLLTANATLSDNEMNSAQ